jgi:hypothetical protein
MEEEATSITIRKVPTSVHRKLAARAAQNGQSLQEYLLGELHRVAERPSAAELLERVRARKSATGSRLSAERIIAHRDADR